MKLVAAAIMIAGGAIAFGEASTSTNNIFFGQPLVGQGQIVGAMVMAVGGIVFAIESFRSWWKGGGEN